MESEVPCVVIDPGIGFGKTLEHNLALLRNIPKFVKSGFPVLVGASRKSMIGSLLDGRAVEERLSGSLAVHYDAITKGAHIIRVHDVQESADAMRIFTAINR
jgi:dihydropteroate synthase